MAAHVRNILDTPSYGVISQSANVHCCLREVQVDQNVSVHLMITLQKVASPHYLVQSDCLAADRQSQGDTRHTLTPSVIPNSNYVIMVTENV
jgi:hypothetical protein